MSRIITYHQTSNTIPNELILFILEYISLPQLSKYVKTLSKNYYTYFQSRLYKTIKNYHNIIYSQQNQQNQQSIPSVIVTPLPSVYSANIHIIYYLLRQLQTYRQTNFRMISPTTFYQHLLPRYSTLSGLIPFIKIPTAMGFYRLVSIYPYTEEPEFFVIDNLGGMTTQDREYNINNYYTKPLDAYKHPLTFPELFYNISTNF